MLIWHKRLLHYSCFVDVGVKWWLFQITSIGFLDKTIPICWSERKRISSWFSLFDSLVKRYTGKHPGAGKSTIGALEKSCSLLDFIVQTVHQETSWYWRNHHHCFWLFFLLDSESCNFAKRRQTTKKSTDPQSKNSSRSSKSSAVYNVLKAIPLSVLSSQPFLLTYQRFSSSSVAVRTPSTPVTVSVGD